MQRFAWHPGARERLGRCSVKGPLPTPCRAHADLELLELFKDELMGAQEVKAPVPTLAAVSVGQAPRAQAPAPSGLPAMPAMQPMAMQARMMPTAMAFVAGQPMATLLPFPAAFYQPAAAASAAVAAAAATGHTTTTKTTRVRQQAAARLAGP